LIVATYFPNFVLNCLVWQSRLIFGIILAFNITVTDDCVIDSIVENLLFFVSKIHYVWHFQPHRVGKPMYWWNSAMSKIMQCIICNACWHACHL